MFDADAWIYWQVKPLASKAFAWLEKDLAKVDRNKTPWLVVLGHRSLYCTKVSFRVLSNVSFTISTRFTTDD